MSSSAAIAGQPDPAAATLARLRQLGVSFISPEDLHPASSGATAPSEQAPTNPPPLAPHPYNSIFLPRAAGLSQSSLWSEDASPDSSLEINSLALKYLDDTQLSRLAEQHRINSKATATASTRGEDSLRGNFIGDRHCVDLSLATQEFLQRHGLAEPEGRRAPLRDVNGGEYLTPTTTSGRLSLSRRPRLEQQLAARNVPPKVNPVLTGGQEGLVPSGRSPFPAARTNPPPPEISNRILDITAIRQQPKLL